MVRWFHALRTLLLSLILATAAIGARSENATVMRKSEPGGCGVSRCQGLNFSRSREYPGRAIVSLAKSPCLLFTPWKAKMNLIRRAVQRRESYAMWIERYKPRWHSQVIQLAKTVFGEGYFTEPWLQTRQQASVMYVACGDEASLYGFAHGRILPKNALRAYLGPEVGDFPPDIREADAAGNLAIIEVVAVAAEHRRQGIGFTLLRATHDALVGVGADKLLVTFKRGPRASDVEGIMRRLGFTLWRKQPSYWREQCNRGEFKCVDRQDQCVCEAMLFRKAVF